MPSLTIYRNSHKIRMVFGVNLAFGHKQEENLMYSLVALTVLLLQLERRMRLPLTRTLLLPTGFILKED